MKITVTEYRTVKLSKVAQALAGYLENQNKSIITDYQLFLILRKIYKNPEGLYLRNKELSVQKYRTTRNLLLKANIIIRDKNYHSAYQILTKQDMYAEEVACLVDPFCYISHLSAMQIYGLTNRRPEALHLTIPANKLLREMIKEKMTRDYEGTLNETSAENIHPLNATHHPPVVRKRKLDILASVHYGDHLEKRGSCVRIATIGQTFLNMLEDPQKCGGMDNIINIWKEHAKTYLDDIIASVDNAPKSIHKVRAGYILEETMSIQKPEILQWTQFAQRGGSRVLDSTKPFKNKYSEKWMLSINA